MVKVLYRVFGLALTCASVAVAFRVGRLLGKLEGIDESNKAHKEAMRKHTRRMRESRMGSR